jgi:hypothetical protein
MAMSNEHLRRTYYSPLILKLFRQAQRGQVAIKYRVRARPKKRIDLAADVFLRK